MPGGGGGKGSFVGVRGRRCGGGFGRWEEGGGIVVGSVGGTDTGGGCGVGGSFVFCLGEYRCGYFAVVTRGRGPGSPEPPHGQNQSRQHHSYVRSIKPGPQS